MTDEQQTAFIRGLIGASISGALVFLGTWSQTEDVRTLVITTATAFLTQISYRFGIEGTVDSASAAKKDAAERGGSAASHG